MIVNFSRKYGIKTQLIVAILRNDGQGIEYEALLEAVLQNDMYILKHLKQHQVNEAQMIVKWRRKYEVRTLSMAEILGIDGQGIEFETWFDSILQNEVYTLLHLKPQQVNEAQMIVNFSRKYGVKALN